uniref:Uncharacterized protein n=1 Tax=Leersia perrieri TaxID=77586 RepID=A0A0D9WQC4_9ORYZ
MEFLALRQQAQACHQQFPRHYGGETWTKRRQPGRGRASGRAGSAAARPAASTRTPPLDGRSSEHRKRWPASSAWFSDEQQAPLMFPPATAPPTASCRHGVMSSPWNMLQHDVGTGIACDLAIGPPTRTTSR